MIKEISSEGFRCLVLIVERYGNTEDVAVHIFAEALREYADEIDNQNTANGDCEKWEAKNGVVIKMIHGIQNTFKELKND